MAEKSLLIQLADRNLISDELLQYRFGSDPEMEKIRLNRESRERDSGSLIPKSGPWHDPQLGATYKKAALQKNMLTPGQVGLTENAKRPEMRIGKSNDGEQKMLVDNSQKPGEKKLAQVPGRPKNSKDKEKRKVQDFKPKIRAELDIWLQDIHKQIAHIINPIYLVEVDKKDMRNLTAQEMKQIERIRFGVLLTLEPLTDLTQSIVANNLLFNQSDTGQVWSKNLDGIYHNCIQDIAKSLGRTLTLAERQQIQSQLYIANLEKQGIVE